MKKSISKKRDINIDPLIDLFFLLVGTPIYEVFHGLRTGLLPLYHCLGFSTVITFLSIVDVDLLILQRFDLTFLYPSNLMLQKIYILLCAFSGFYGWGLTQSLLQLRLRMQLTKAFTDAGLKTATGRMPAFVFDRAIDEETRRLRLRRNGSSLEQFKEAQKKIEGDLSIYIDQIKEDRVSGTVDIIYSQQELVSEFAYPDLDTIGRDSFWVGKGRAKTIRCKLQDYPHLLIAGQTGGGKSTFLRQFVTTLYLKNPSYQFKLVDPKMTELHLFQGLERIEVFTDVELGIGMLQKCSEEILSERKKIISLNECVDFDALLAIPEKQRKYPEKVVPKNHRSRIIIVIDEAGSLFMSGITVPERVKKAKQFASTIASQGRALGMHIVLATQRPDRFAIDPQIKANLVGKLCYRMPNNASSMTVLDSKRATEIGKTKGRAIWQGTNEMFEVQTPNLPTQEALDFVKIGNSDRPIVPQRKVVIKESEKNEENENWGVNNEESN